MACASEGVAARNSLHKYLALILRPFQEQNAKGRRTENVRGNRLLSGCVIRRSGGQILNPRGRIDVAVPPGERKGCRKTARNPSQDCRSGFGVLA